MRIGPEYSEKFPQSTSENEARVKKDLGFRVNLNDLNRGTSLGEKESAIATLDLAYYLAGKEGQNPFQLLSYEGKPYRQSLEIATARQPIQTIQPQNNSSSPKPATRIDVLFKELSATQTELQSVRQEILRLKQQQSFQKK